VLLGVMIALQLGATFVPAQQWTAVESAFGLLLFWRGEFQPDRLYTLLTYGLLHAGWGHLVFNALWIAILGSQVHQILGAPRFLVFFALSTVAAGLVQVAATWGETTFTVGASGFVYALLACIGHLYVVGPQDSLAERVKKLAVFTAAIIVLNVAFAYVAGGFVTGGGIAWQAHAGGFLAGLLLFPLLARGAVRARRGGAG
jgi:membrane associated rhomboid family serine protease